MNELCKEFEKNISKYNDYRIKVDSLIREILIQNKLSYHKIESRVKDSKRLDEKIQRKNSKYSELNEITDLVGVRIITFYEDEVDKIAEIIEKEFIKDPKNSVDKRVLENDKFGYRSLHYVVSLSEERKVLTEYSRFFDLKIEIQIRSILQHAWAEIEHDIGYKGEFEIPDEFKRNFYRVAALLETSDLEFLRIRDGLRIYEKTIATSITNNPENVELNLASLTSYISNSKLVEKIDIKLCELSGMSYSNSEMDYNWELKMLYFFGIDNINSVEENLISFEEKIPEFAKNWLSASKNDYIFDRGISIFYLGYILLAKKNNDEDMKQYFESFLPDNHSEKLIAVYEETFK